MSRIIDVTMYRKPCIDVAQFCNDLCIGQNVAKIRDTFVAFCCSPIHSEPTGFAVCLLLKYIDLARLNSTSIKLDSGNDNSFNNKINSFFN